MESALSISTASLSLSTISKALTRRLSATSPSHFPTLFLTHTRYSSSLRTPLRGVCAVVPLLLLRRSPRLECFSTSAASFGGSGGGFGGESSGGGGGDGSGGGDGKANLVGGGSGEVAAFIPDVIILDVGGMTCGGCAASVKRILESQAQVSSASVNLASETAVVWPVSEAKVLPNWKTQLGEALARHLTNCGFTSNLREPDFVSGSILEKFSYKLVW